MLPEGEAEGFQQALSTLTAHLAGEMGVSDATVVAVEVLFIRRARIVLDAVRSHSRCHAILVVARVEQAV